MKLIPLLLLAIITSCSPAKDAEKIYGSWTTIENPKYMQNNLSDVVTFTAPDKIRVELLQDQQVKEVVEGTFTVHNDTLTTVYSAGTFKFHIRELSEKNIVAKPMQGTIMLKMRKLN